MLESLEFDAGSFSDLSETELGQNLWNFLKEEGSIIRMETACYLSRPALEPLQPLLISRFSDQVRDDRIKQMAGRMVRQIMESLGHNLDQTGVKLRNNELFGSAARYKY